MIIPTKMRMMQMKQWIMHMGSVREYKLVVELIATLDFATYQRTIILV